MGGLDDSSDDDDDLLFTDPLRLSRTSASTRRSSRRPPLFSCAHKRNETPTTAMMSNDRTKRLLDDVLEDYRREQTGTSKMGLLRSKEKQVLEQASLHEEMVQKQRQESNGRDLSLSVQDQLAGLADLYPDFHVFSDKSIVAKRMKALDSSSCHRYGGRSHLIRYCRRTASQPSTPPHGQDVSVESLTRVYESFEDAMKDLRSILPSPFLSDWTPSSIGVARLRRFIDRQLSDESVDSSTKQTVTRWLYRVAMTGSGSTEGTCPLWSRLSESALQVLVQWQNTSGSDSNTELHSLDLFHCSLDCYRLFGREDREANTIKPVRTNEQGLENLLTYWSDERIFQTDPNSLGISTELVTNLVVQLSRLLLDESLSSLHNQVQRSVSALLRVASRQSSSSIQAHSFAQHAGQSVMNELQTLVGPVRLSDKVRIVDDDQASLATAYLLDKLLTLPNDSRSVAVSLFQLECAYHAFARFGIENTRESSNDESYKEYMARPSSGPVESEWWSVTRQAVLTSIHVLQAFPRDKSQGPRCLALLDSALALFRAGLGWWPATLQSGALKTVATQGEDAEFGAPEQAQVMVQVLQRLSSVLEEVGQFADRYRFSEHFCCVSEHVHLFDRYMAGIALTRCCSQAGISLAPKALQQQVVTDYFQVKSL